MALYSSLEPDTYSLRSLPRQPSLESQGDLSPPPMTRRWMKLLRAAGSPPDEDENEIRLKHAIERHASSNDHSFRPILRQLLREYIRFKKRPTVGLVDIFRCWTFTPSPIHSWTEQSTYSTDAECELETDPPLRHD